MPVGHIVIALTHAIVGWALCGATMGIGLAKLSLKPALVVHAIAAPVIFTVISGVYYTSFGFTAPIVTAAVFVGVVMALDVVVVAVLIQREFTMFRSVLGTWLPFALIFGSTYLVGRLAQL